MPSDKGHSSSGYVVYWVVVRHSHGFSPDMTRAAGVSRVKSVHARRCSNTIVWVGSVQEVLKYHGSGRVGSPWPDPIREKGDPTRGNQHDEVEYFGKWKHSTMSERSHELY